MLLYLRLPLSYFRLTRNSSSSRRMLLVGDIRDADIMLLRCVHLARNNSYNRNILLVNDLDGGEFASLQLCFYG